MLPDQEDDSSPGKIYLGVSILKEVARPTRDCSQSMRGPSRGRRLSRKGDWARLLTPAKHRSKVDARNEEPGPMLESIQGKETPQRLQAQ